MKYIKDLNDLMVEQLRDMYNAEELFDPFLPEIGKAIQSDELAKIVKQYHLDNEGQIMRLRQVFEQQLFVEDRGEHCEAMRAMVKEARDLIQHSVASEVRDAGIITALQHIIHYKIAGYGAICSYATALKLTDVAGIIHKNLEEEKKTDSRLAILAEEVVNNMAIGALV